MISLILIVVWVGKFGPVLYFPDLVFDMVIQEILVPEMVTKSPESGVITPAHTTKVTEHYLERNSIKTMFYFGKGLEVNPIGN